MLNCPLCDAHDLRLSCLLFRRVVVANSEAENHGGSRDACLIGREGGLTSPCPGVENVLKSNGCLRTFKSPKVAPTTTKKRAPFGQADRTNKLWKTPPQTG